MSINEPPNNEAQERFEKYLGEFRPVAPRELTILSRRASWGILAVAAAVLLSIALSLILRNHGHPSDSAFVARAVQPVVQHVSMDAASLTLGRLDVALRTSDQDLNQILDDASSRVLPRGHQGTALFELGKE